MKATLTFLMAIVLMLGLVFSGPAQSVAAEAAASTAAVTIEPVTLVNAVYGTYSTQYLTASWDGSEPIGLKVISGSLPTGITLDAVYNGEQHVGRLHGAPEETGEFRFTVEAYTNPYGTPNDSLGTEEYTWQVVRAKPKVTFGQIQTYLLQEPPYSKVTSLPVIAEHDTIAGNWPFQPSGTVSITANGQAVANCKDLAPLWGQSYGCTTEALVAMDPGTYTLEAVFTPGESWAANYESASGTASFTVLPKVEVLLFNDLDGDGVRDQGEEPTAGMVALDNGCDGTYESNEYNSGTKSAIVVAPGQYCLNVPTFLNWRPTRPENLPISFTVSATANRYFEVGLYNTVISVSPETLPDATVGQYYEQTIAIAGGKSPYTIVDAFTTELPEGMTFDQATLTLSGTPTTAESEYGSLYLRVKDAEGMYGERSWTFAIIRVKVDGAFTFASSVNPSAFGEAVTFTFSGSGAEELPGLGPIPPTGTVAFYDGEELITGCGEVYLNIRDDEETGGQILGDYPATCTTTLLNAGSHGIRASYTDWTELYKDASRTLTQVVGALTNTAPTANPGGPYLGAINTVIAFDGSLSIDPESDPLTYAWTFGDSGTGTGVNPSHTYAAVGVYDVCLTVNDGKVDSAPSCTLGVVYDPSAGFVTGSGWIDSQAGAYKTDQTLSGKATFGFVSKYKKGATLPEGNTEFQFEAGSFKFHSTAYEWLVVDGKTKAQFKGSGLVNGTLDPDGKAYKFLVSAGDGSPDTFRIRIWSEAAGVETVVYDNGVNQAIGGGSIVVHTNK